MSTRRFVVSAHTETIVEVDAETNELQEMAAVHWFRRVLPEVIGDTIELRETLEHPEARLRIDNSRDPSEDEWVVTE